MGDIAKPQIAKNAIRTPDERNFIVIAYVTFFPDSSDHACSLHGRFYQRSIRYSTP